MAKTYIGWAAAAGLAMLAAAPAAAGSGWTSVGRTTLAGGVGTATTPLRWESGFSELLVCADGGAVRLTGATLHLSDGTTKALRIGDRLKQGACTAELKVGRGHGIAAIDFAYEASPSGGALELSVAAR
jgi:hypothetical protein